MHKYKPTTYWSEEDNVFIAEVSELSGCIAHGDTEQIAEDNANNAIELWIKTAKEFGDVIPEPKEQLASKNYGPSFIQ